MPIYSIETFKKKWEQQIILILKDVIKHELNDIEEILLSSNFIVKILTNNRYLIIDNLLLAMQNNNTHSILALLNLPHAKIISDIYSDPAQVINIFMYSIAHNAKNIQLKLIQDENFIKIFTTNNYSSKLNKLIKEIIIKYSYFDILLICDRENLNINKQYMETMIKSLFFVSKVIHPDDLNIIYNKYSKILFKILKLLGIITTNCAPQTISLDTLQKLSLKFNNNDCLHFNQLFVSMSAINANNAANTILLAYKIHYGAATVLSEFVNNKITANNISLTLIDGIVCTHLTPPARYARCPPTSGGHRS